MTNLVWYFNCKQLSTNKVMLALDLVLLQSKIFLEVVKTSY